MAGVPRTSGVLETSLYVADLDRSCDFYQRVFGFERFVHDGLQLETPKGTRLTILSDASR